MDKPLVKVTIDGKELQVPQGTLVIDAARKAGIDIPHYCYHPALGNPGNCRLCIVEVEGMPRPQVSCRLPAAEGLKVRSDSPGARRAQRSSLELHLVNHPLDCPVCDQAGECWLQDYYMRLGPYTSAVKEDKRHKGKRIPLGERVMLDQERCVLCTRCTRFVDNVTKTYELGIFNRGDREILAPYPGRTLDGNAYSGNVVDPCPVGALTDRDFRFKARVWYLRSTPSICGGCARGCAIDMEVNTRLWHTDGERVARYKPRVNPEVNGYWLCDEGRYSYKSHDKDRLGKFREKTADGYARHEWADGLGVLAERLRHGIQSRGSKGLAVILSGRLSNEDFHLARKLFVETLQAGFVVFGPEPDQVGEEDALLRRREKVPNLRGGEALGFGPKVQDAGWDAVREGIEKGTIWGLYVVDRDPTAVWGEKTADLVSRLYLTVYQGSHAGGFMPFADWILPAATFAEEDGTFTNFQGRVQRYRKAVEPLVQARSDWEIWRDLLPHWGEHLGFESAAGVFENIAEREPAFEGLDWNALEPNGAMLKGAK